MGGGTFLPWDFVRTLPHDAHVPGAGSRAGRSGGGGGGGGGREKGGWGGGGSNRSNILSLRLTSLIGAEFSNSIRGLSQKEV